MSENKAAIKGYLYPKGEKPYKDLYETPWIYEKGKGAFYPSVGDVLKMYTAINYLIGEEPFNRKAIQEKFFNNKKDKIKDFIFSYFKGDSSDHFKDVRIDVVKGSVYKIKKYFLENSKLKDIRGGSTIINYLNGEVVYQVLKEEMIEECAVYLGGGNVFIISKEGMGKKLCRELENRYTSLSLTAMNAFESISCSLNQFFYQYKEVARRINDKLEDRKKMKIYPVNLDSDLEEVTIKGKAISLRERKIKEGKICSGCNIREAKYPVETFEGEIYLCPSCFRKNRVGNEKNIFYHQFKEFTGKEIKGENIKVIGDLGDKNGHIALIYGDGNNMGDIVMNIENPFEMMYFSRKTDNVTKGCVYNALSKVLGGDLRFEVIALGGDDIFIIVPGDKALDIGKEIITNFDEAFDKNITLSMGICFARSKTPVAVMFNLAAALLKRAKKFIGENNLKEGSLDILEIEGTSMIDFSKGKTGIFPMTISSLKNTLEVVNNIKKDKKLSKNAISNLNYASKSLMEEEYQLYYLFKRSKAENDLDSYVRKMLNIKEGELFGGVKDGVYPWDDLLLLWDYTGGDV